MEIPDWWSKWDLRSHSKTFGDFRNNGETMDYVVFNCHGVVVIGKDESAQSALQKLRSLHLTGWLLKHHLRILYGNDLKFIIEGGQYPVYLSCDCSHSELRVSYHGQTIRILACSPDEAVKAVSHLNLTPSQRDKVSKAMSKMLNKKSTSSPSIL